MPARRWYNGDTGDVMAVSFELPSEIELNLRRSLGDLDQAAKEAALVELYRQGRVSRPELSEALGLSRYEVDGLLKRHNVTEDLPTIEELADDLERLRKVRA
jgi:predicted HTH domain antitoxin